MKFEELIPKARPIRISDRELIGPYFSKYPPEISEHTFAILFCWAEIKHYFYYEYNDHLLISFRDGSGNLRFYPPIGPHPEKILEMDLSGLKRYKWSRIPESLAGKFTGHHAVYERDFSDYVYRRSDLIDLPGKKYDGKRNFIKRFRTTNPVTRKLRSVDVQACIAIQEIWLQNQKNNPSALEESSALTKALSHFDTLKWYGIGVFIGEKMVGYAIGEPLNRNTFVEHFEKALPEYKGVYQYLLQEFAKSVPAEYEFINREEDLGNEGLRKSKKSWYPERLIKKYCFPMKS